MDNRIRSSGRKPGQSAPTAAEIVEELRALGDPGTRDTLIRHGARDPVFGVRVGDMKPIQRRVKCDYPLALDLYDTGISDAMYLAGLIADDARMTPNDLERWARAAYWSLLYSCTVPWTAASGAHGWELGHTWIDDSTETVVCAGWYTLGSLVSITSDSHLDLSGLERLLDGIVERSVDTPPLVRRAMTGFLTSVGGYVAPLTEAALTTADRMGRARPGGAAACKEPDVRRSIEAMQARGNIGKKRKSARC